MTDWLLANLDEVYATVVGFTTAGAFLYAYWGNRYVAGLIGLSGNALWYAYALTVGTVMLLFPIVVLTFIHGYNLRLGWRERRRIRTQTELVASTRVSASPRTAERALELLNQARSGAPCPVCGHLRGTHNQFGCGTVLDGGRPCSCHVTHETEEHPSD